MRFSFIGISHFAYIVSNAVTLRNRCHFKPRIQRIYSMMHSLSRIEEPDYHTFLSNIYSKNNIFSVYVSGGGITLVNWLFVVPGASKCLMEGSIPYSQMAMENHLSINYRTKDFPQIEYQRQYCSSETAIDIADVGRIRTASLLLDNSRSLNRLADMNVFALGCTASLASSQPKRGPHRCYIAISTNFGTSVLEINFIKGVNSRLEEDFICSKYALQAIVDCGNNQNRIQNINHQEIGVESVRIDSLPRPDCIESLLMKNMTQLLLVPKVSKDVSQLPTISDTPSDALDEYLEEFSHIENVKLPTQSIIYPGSFNPLHEGHLKLVKAALRSLGRDNDEVPVVFEISVKNVDKPSLSKEEIMKRIQQFHPKNNPILRNSGLSNFAVAISTEPLFLNKSRLFPGCYILIGSDTLSRLIDPKYYQQSPLEMLTALTRIQEQRTEFIVGGRVEQKPSLKSEPVITTDMSSELDSRGEDSGTSSSISLGSPSPSPGSCFLTLEDVLLTDNGRMVPPSVRSMFRGLTETDFRLDISSSEIRQRNKHL